MMSMMVMTAGWPLLVNNPCTTHYDRENDKSFGIEAESD